MPRDGSGTFTAPAGTTATSGTTIESAKYNAFVNDLVTDGNTARPIVAGGTGATTAGAALAALGGQPLDAGLTSIAGLTTAADRMIYTTAADTYAVATLTAAGRNLLDDADAAAQLVTLGAAALASPTFTGTPAAPTAAVGTDTTQIASTAYVRSEIPNQLNASGSAPIYAARAWVNFHGVATNGTYSRTGNTVTVTMTGHGMSTGMIADLNFTSGTATDGSYAVTVTDANTYTITDPASGATSGNVTRNTYIRASGNVTSITRNAVGDYTINFTTALLDANYATTAHVEVAPTGTVATFIANETTASRTSSACRFIVRQVGGADPGVALNNASVNVVVFR